MERGQLIILVVAALVIFYQSFQGWRLGPVRQLLRIAAIVAAYAASYLGSAAIVPTLRPLGYPDFILQALGGLCLGLVVYFLVSAVGGILFKKTTDQQSTLIWFVYGVMGALLGIAFGVVMVVAVAVAIRFLGTLAESSIRKPVAAAEVQSGAPKTNPAIAGLIQVKRTLEEGVVGEVLQTVDPVPNVVYVTIGKIGQMASNPEAIERFLSFPGAKELVSDPEIIALRGDPKIADSLVRRDYVALFKNPKMLKVANDPRIGAMLKKFELQQALSYALKQ